MIAVTLFCDVEGCSSKHESKIDMEECYAYLRGDNELRIDGSFYATYTGWTIDNIADYVMCPDHNTNQKETPS